MRRSLQKYHPTQLREDLLQNSPSKKTPNHWVTRTIKRKEDYGASPSNWRNKQIKTTDIVRSFTDSFNLDTWKKFQETKIQMPATNCFYLPHHFVIKDASSTAKLRVVFEASAKSTIGVSLNDCLIVGPKLQKDLFGILIRFRFHHVALSADIAKMYRQVQLDGEEKNFHRVCVKI